jgi:hypothetical protein
VRLCGIFDVALSLYPADYRVRFGREMRVAFIDAAAASRRAGPLAFVEFAAAEAAGLAVGVLREWICKLGSDPLSRARVLPDCRRMRPVGLTREEWAAGLDDVS